MLEFVECLAEGDDRGKVSVKCLFHDVDLCMYALVLVDCLEGNVEIMRDSMNGCSFVVPLGDMFKYEPPKGAIASLPVPS